MFRINLGHQFLGVLNSKTGITISAPLVALNVLYPLLDYYLALAPF